MVLWYVCTLSFAFENHAPLKVELCRCYPPPILTNPAYTPIHARRSALARPQVQVMAAGHKTIMSPSCSATSASAASSFIQLEKVLPLLRPEKGSELGAASVSG